MHADMKRFLFWAPRVLGILFALFMSLFALDVFGAGRSFWQALPGFLVHLIPVYALIVVLILAWRWEWIGAVLFAALGVLYIVWAWGSFHWSAYALISGPLLLLGLLFLLGWIYRAQVRSR